MSKAFRQSKVTETCDPASGRDCNGSNGMPDELQDRQRRQGWNARRHRGQLAAREGVESSGRLFRRQQPGVVVAVAGQVLISLSSVVFSWRGVIS